MAGFSVLFTQQSSKIRHIKNQSTTEHEEFSMKKRPELYIFILFIFPIITYLLLQISICGYIGMRPLRELTNIGLFLFPVLFLFLVSKRPYVPLAMMSVFWGIFALANIYMLRFRERILFPADLCAAGSFADVIKSYDFTPDDTAKMTLVLFSFITAGTFWYFMNSKEAGRTIRQKLPTKAAVLPAALFLLNIAALLFLPDHVFCQNKFNSQIEASDNGVAADFIRNIKVMSPAAPDGYDESSAAAILPAPESPARKPNIIVVMCEAFSDPAVLGDVKANKDYIPNFRRITSDLPDTVSGEMYVSVFGGGTAITEFEFLTGMSDMFYPVNSYQYIQFVRAGKDYSYTLPSYLSSLGYTTEAIHPGDATTYNRDKVYQLFGFEQTFFKDDFTDPELVRSYISDREVFSRIIERYEKRDRDKPYCVFCVTIQNHADYSDDSAFDKYLEQEGLTAMFEGGPLEQSEIFTEYGNKGLDTYLGLEYITDAALKYLIEYFDQQEEDTVILFFGDHQPSEVLDGIAGSNVKETDKLRVPFLLHANFDIEEQHGVVTSPIYLQDILADAAGTGRCGLQAYLHDLRQDIPVLTGIGVIDKNGDLTETPDRINEYRNLWYYLYSRRK